MKYKKGYKYQLAEDYVFATGIIGYTYDSDYLRLTPIGILTAKKGYAWDGASSVVIDTKTVIRASLIHDCLYELLRKEALPAEEKVAADKIYYNICIEDGCCRFRAAYMLKGLAIGGRAATLPKNKKKIYEI